MEEYFIDFYESRLKFTFDNRFWQNIVKLDEHIDFKNVEKLDGVKGVDFIGIWKKNHLFFIEVKNFRNYKIDNKERLQNEGEELMLEVAHKIKDSIACIIAGNRNSNNHEELWSEFTDIIINKNFDIKIVLWLETDDIQNESSNIRQSNRIKTKFVSLSDYQRKLQTKLKWFVKTRRNVKILNILNYNDEYNFSVENLPK